MPGILAASSKSFDLSRFPSSPLCFSDYIHQRAQQFLGLADDEQVYEVGYGLRLRAALPPATIKGYESPLSFAHSGMPARSAGKVYW
jgi:hypothetical protein